jgi:hypothetical protein
MRLVSTVALAVFLAASSSTEAFGPAQPLQATSAFGGRSIIVSNNYISSSSSSNSNNNGGNHNGVMTMRIGTQDMGRKQRLNEILKQSLSKETVQNELLTLETSELIQKCNWRVRRSLIRKIQNQAKRFDLTVDPTFGVP